MTGRMRLVRGFVALIVGASGGLVISSGSAFAAACPAGTGVTVVVNSGVRCDANGGGPAASNFGDAGHALKRTQRFPGFVCRIDNAPANDPCVTASPADAYWGLFWSDGTSGKWIYSNVGVDGLTVPKGGWVAFVFQNSNARTFPSMTPRTKAPVPTKPSSRPSGRATKAPATTPPTRFHRSTDGSTKPGESSPSAGSTSATPGAKESAKQGSKESDEPGAKGSAAPSAGTESKGAGTEGADSTSANGDQVERTSAETESGSTALVWVGLALAIALAAGTMFTVTRRRAGRQ